MPPDTAESAATTARSGFSARVREVTDLTPRMRRMRLEAPTFESLEIYPGQDVTLRVPAASGDGEPQTTVKRRYTVRRHDPGGSAIDIDVVVHGHGPGGRWASAVTEGDVIEVTGPRGKVRLADVEEHLFAADEAGLPAVAAMAHALPASARIHAFLEVADAAEEQPVETAAHCTVEWLHRHGEEPGRSRILENAIRGADLTGIAAAYVFTESRLARELRSLLLERGLSPSLVVAKGYWNLPR